MRNTSDGNTWMDNAAVPKKPAPSVALTVKLTTAPEAEGVPVIVPDGASRFRPGGSEPLFSVHVRGPKPPVAASDVR